MKKLYKVSCVLIALMFVSVSCFGALGPDDSKDTSDTTTALSSASEEDIYQDQMEQEYFTTLENKPYIVISARFMIQLLEHILQQNLMKSQYF